MTANSSLLIRHMTPEEVQNIAIQWALEEGWNPGLYDAGCFLAADPEGFLGAWLGDEPVACISAVTYDHSFAFVGFYIVKPKFRGKGFGLQIWNAAMAQVQQRNIGLDGVVAQQENYRKSGFKLAYRNIRFEGRSIRTEQSFEGIVPANTLPMEMIEKYDRSCFPATRTQFLQCWLQQPQSLALVAMKNGKTAGYGHIRSCHQGYKIGPLFADDKAVAEALYLSLGNFTPPDSLIYLDIPEINQNAIDFAEQLQMTKVFETARMYTVKPPDINLERVFGVSTFELG